MAIEEFKNKLYKKLAIFRCASSYIQRKRRKCTLLTFEKDIEWG